MSCKGIIILLAIVTSSEAGPFVLDYLMEGDIVLNGDAKCVGQSSFMNLAARTDIICVTLHLKEGSQPGTFILEDTSDNGQLTLSTGNQFSFSVSGSDLKFSTGTEELTEIADLIDPDNPFLIILASEDPTNPTNCLKHDETYGACTFASDTFYFDPSDCSVMDCKICIPDTSVCNTCNEGFAVDNNACSGCSTVYGANCDSCNNANCLNCDSEKVLKANTSTDSACTDPCEMSVANCDHCDVSADTCSECSEGFELDDNSDCIEVTTTTEEMTTPSSDSSTNAGNRNRVSLASLLAFLPLYILNVGEY